MYDAIKFVLQNVKIGFTYFVRGVAPVNGKSMPIVFVSGSDRILFEKRAGTYQEWCTQVKRAERIGR